MKITPFLKTVATLSISTLIFSCSPSSEKTNFSADRALSSDSVKSFSLRNPEELAIYAGDLNMNGKESYVTLTLIGSDQYTLEEVETTHDNTTLIASTGTYSFSEVANPANPTSILDILTLKADDGVSSLSFVFLEDDSFWLIDDMSTYTGREENTLKKENIES